MLSLVIQKILHTMKKKVINIKRYISNNHLRAVVAPLPTI